MILDIEPNREIRTKRFSIALELAWNEIQSGSQISAMATVNEIIANLEGRKNIPQQEMLWLQDAYRQKMLNCARLMKPQMFFETFEKFIQNPRTLQQNRSALTRLLLQCCSVNFPFEAYKVAKILLAEIEQTGDEYASLCSDIGRIFLQNDPKIAYKWWKKGIKPAVSARQVSHSTINNLVGALYAEAKFPSPQKIKAVKEAVKEMGVDNQLIRITIFEGVQAASTHDYEMAGYYFRQALQISQNVNQVFWEWKCHNNLAVLAFLNQEMETAIGHFEKAYTILEETIQFSQTSRNTVLQAIDIVISLNVRNEQKDILELPGSSALSGLFNVLLWNGQFIGNRIAKMKNPPLQSSEQHPLMIYSGKRKLFFAIE